MSDGKIQVKIITTGYVDDKDDVHLLSSEDTSAFKNMIVSILVNTQSFILTYMVQCTCILLACHGMIMSESVVIITPQEVEINLQKWMFLL